MRSCLRMIFAASLGLSAAGCSVQQLHDNTVDIGNSVGSIYAKQVLANLYSLSDDPYAIPSFFTVSKGSIETSNAVTPSLSIPLGNQVTRTVATGGVTQIVGPYNGLGLGVAEGWQQTWEIAPETDADALRILHAVYRYALGDKRELDTLFPPFARIRSPPPKPAVTVLGHRTLEQDIINFRAHCAQSMLPNGACFQVEADGECARTGNGQADRLCLGQYRTTYESLARRREMIVSSRAYYSGVLYDLVLVTLQAQADATAARK